MTGKLSRDLIHATTPLVSVTDGILEVQNPEGVEFGMSRVEEVLAEHSTAPLGELAQFIISSVRSWGVQGDDQTLPLIRASNQAAPGREPSDRSQRL